MNSSDHRKLRIGVVGAGSWGTALANLLAVKGYVVDLWAFEPEVAEQIRTQGENQVFLPGIVLSKGLNPTTDLSQVAADKNLLLLVVPSHVMRLVAGRLDTSIAPDTIVVSASKGIENKTHCRMTEILKAVLPAVPSQQLAVLSGPSFALEVAAQVPTLVAVAAENIEIAWQVQQIFATDFFRVYTNTDTIGVELGGAVKNVIAVAAGICDGLGLGLNTRAALITRGQTEIRRLGVKMGANPRTFTGLAGIGDLILTCTGTLSRNYTVGRRIGQGEQVAEILSGMRMVAEGVKTAKSVYNLSRKLDVEMPICHTAYHVLYEGLSPKIAVQDLMTRDLKPELDDL